MIAALVSGNEIEISHRTEPLGPRGRSGPQILVALRRLAGAGEMVCLSTKSREVIFGSRIWSAKIRAEGAREAAEKAAAKPIAPRPRRGDCEWRVTGGRHNLRRRS